MKASDSEAVRIYDRELEDFPVTVELYGKYARVVDYSPEGLGDAEMEELLDILSRNAYIPTDHMIVKGRKKMEGRDQRKSEEESLVVTVKENGLSFECELVKYTDTGLFLDQAGTRAAVKDISEGMRVLNLFAYTGSFSVYAAAGGAESVVSVDLSNVYSAWNRRNFKANGFLDESKYRTVAADCRVFLEESVKNGDRYDLVIFDPPSFSNSHKALDFDVRKDYKYFLYLINQILVPGGVVVFSENLSGFEFSKNSLKAWWKIQEVTSGLRAQGFTSKRSSLRVWVMKKAASMDERAARKRNMDEERLELEEEPLKAAEPEIQEEEETEVSAEQEERTAGEPEEKREEKPRHRDSRPRDRYSDRPRYSDDRPRDRYSDRGSRPRNRYSDDRPRDRYSDRDSRPRDRYSERPRYSDERPRDRYSDRDSRPRDRYSDRPRYSDDRPRDSYRQRDSFRGRQDRRDGDWDNDTSRAYRESRKRDNPKPYGYDGFMRTSKRDKASTEWMKNTEIRKTDDKED